MASPAKPAFATDLGPFRQLPTLRDPPQHPSDPGQDTEALLNLTDLIPLQRFDTAIVDCLSSGAPPAVLQRTLARRMAEARERSASLATRDQGDSAAARAITEAAKFLDDAVAQAEQPALALSHYARAGVVLQRARVLTITKGESNQWLRVFHSCIAFSAYEEVSTDALAVMATLMRGVMSTTADIGTVRRALVAAGFRLIPVGALVPPKAR